MLNNKRSELYLMELSDLSYSEIFNIKDFLLNLANLSNGDIRKKFDFDLIWSKMNKTRSVPIDDSYFKNRFLPLLKNKEIIKVHNDDDISITYDGIYTIASLTNQSVYNFNIFPKSEIEFHSKRFLKSLMDFLNQIRKKEVTIREFKEFGFPDIGLTALIQISDYLSKLGLIKQKEMNQEIFISFPSKAVKPPTF
jgi:hypothetical protein